MADRIWSSPTRPEDLEAYRLRGGSRGCLLIHGFAGTPPEMRDLAEHLAAHGYDVMVPLLAGHGSSPEAMRGTRWQDWVESAEAALASLHRDCPQVFVGGQSLGGSIALHLAARHPELRGVVSLAAMGSRRFFRDPRLRFLPALKYVVRWQVPDASCDLGDPERLLALHSYARRPTAAIDSLMRLLDLLERELPMIRMPALVVHGRRDPFFPVGNGETLAREIPGARLLVLERASTAIPDAAADLVATAMLGLLPEAPGPRRNTRAHCRPKWPIGAERGANRKARRRAFRWAGSRERLRRTPTAPLPGRQRLSDRSELVWEG
jgi:carboxylesterase